MEQRKSLSSSSPSSASSPDSNPAVSAYLDLLKKSLVNWLYHEAEHKVFLELGQFALVKKYPFNEAQRKVGRDFSVHAHTLLGFDRLDNLQHCVETVVREKVPGDFIETGAWRGGACILMRGALKALGVENRTIWVADSFEGLPKPNAEKYPDDEGDTHHTMNVLAVSVETVKENFRRYGLLDDQVKFLKGWFKDTLPNAPVEELAILRMDGDMYESTMDAFYALYDKVSPGGFVIIDDYGAVPACKKAVEDFRKEKNIQDEMHTIDWTGVFWRKS